MMLKKSPFILILLLAGALRAEQSNYAGGSSAARWLKIPSSPRSIAQAGAPDALADDLAGMGGNPAGLSQLQAGAASFSHNSWISDLSLEHLALGWPLHKGAALALGVDYADLGSVDSYSLGANGLPQAQGTLHPSGLALDLDWGQELPAGLSWGVGAEMIRETLQEQATAMAANLGLQWRWEGMGLGAALRHLGSLNGSSLPADAELGLAYAPMGSPMQLSLTLGQDLNGQEGPTLSVGEEYWIRSLLALRGGYQAGNGLSATGPTVGFGLRYRAFTLNYAFDDRGTVGASQQMSLDVSFGPGSSPPVASTPAPTPVAAAPVATPAAPAEADPVHEVHQVLDALDRGDTLSAQALTERLMDQHQPQRQSLAQEIREEDVAPEIFQGEFQEAEKALTLMVKLDRATAYQYEALATVQWYLGKDQDALENMRKAYLLDPGREYLKTKILQMGGTIPQ